MAKRKDAGGYGAMRRSAAERSRRESEKGREIGPPPAVQNPKRRAKTSKSFRSFCEVYYRRIFYLPWSPDHLKVIARIEDAVLRGGLMALAMPRGGGKTSLCEAACEWAILTGARRYVALVAVNDTFAKKMLGGIKTRWETNDLLLEDFPEVIHAVRALDRLANRCKGQICEGRPTFLEWGAELVVLPTLAPKIIKRLGVAEANGCSSVLEASGLVSVRGMHLLTAEGSYLRPDLVIIDDPQRDDTARSPTQCRDRVEILTGAVVELCGPDVEMAGVMPCTVIKPGDMADEILDRDLHPEWRGERLKRVYAFPKNEKLWDEYGELYLAGLKDGTVRAANAFYRKHRKAMDKGAVVAWPERFKKGEVSGLQSAMNVKIKNEEAFWAEHQNEPLPAETDALEGLEPDHVAGKVNSRPRGQVPLACHELTAFIDVQERLLYHTVVAWDAAFGGYVVDYGTYPNQKRAQFTARRAPRTLKMAHRGMGLDAAIYAGLDALTKDLLGREWKQEGGAVMRIGLCLIDCNWGQQTETVYQFCRQSVHAPVLTPSRGQGIGASNRPLSEYRRGRGDKIGHHWWIPSVKGKRALKHVEIDTNYWKSFIHERFATAMGDKGCLSIFGKKAFAHRMLAEHVTAEYRVRTFGRGRTVDEWKSPTNKPDNHWFDCLVGCACAASMRGVSFEGVVTGRAPAPKEKPNGGWAEVQRRKKRARQKRRR